MFESNTDVKKMWDKICIVLCCQ